MCFKTIFSLASWMSSLADGKDGNQRSHLKGSRVTVLNLVSNKCWLKKKKRLNTASFSYHQPAFRVKGKNAWAACDPHVCVCVWPTCVCDPHVCVTHMCVCVTHSQTHNHQHYGLLPNQLFQPHWWSSAPRTVQPHWWLHCLYQSCGL